MITLKKRRTIPLWKVVVNFKFHTEIFHRRVLYLFLTGPSLAWVQWVQLHSGCSCTHRFPERLILHPQIIRKEDFYTLDFRDFPSKVTLSIVFCRISKKLHPQFLNPNDDPVWHNWTCELDSLQNMIVQFLLCLLGKLWDSNCEINNQTWKLDNQICSPVHSLSSRQILTREGKPNIGRCSTNHYLGHSCTLVHRNIK